MDFDFIILQDVTDETKQYIPNINPINNYTFGKQPSTEIIK